MRIKETKTKEIKTKETNIKETATRETEEETVLEEDYYEETVTTSVPMVYSEPDYYWKKVEFLYQTAMDEVLMKLNIMNHELKMLDQHSPIEHINSRIKSPPSIMKKLQKKGLASTIENIVNEIHDVAGIRVICSFSNEIFELVEYIRNRFDITVIEEKDYVTNPKPNGYMSYHMIVSVPVPFLDKKIYTKVEIQIRTSAMDFWASLEHKINYKYEGNAPEHLKRELKECADITAFLDHKMEAVAHEFRFSEGMGEKTPDWSGNMQHLRDMFQ